MRRSGSLRTTGGGLRAALRRSGPIRPVSITGARFWVRRSTALWRPGSSAGDDRNLIPSASQLLPSVNWHLESSSPIAQKLLMFQSFIGGPCRARTYDPLIKSLLSPRHRRWMNWAVVLSNLFRKSEQPQRQGLRCLADTPAKFDPFCGGNAVAVYNGEGRGAYIGSLPEDWCARVSPWRYWAGKRGERRPYRQYHPCDRV